MNSRARTNLSLVFILAVFLTVHAGCSNPISRFTKQYKCQVAGKPEPRTAYEYVERGMEHANASEYDCALGACSEAIRLDSRLSTGYACRGGVLGSRGDYLKALKDFDTALNLQPDNGDFYYSRAQVHDRLGNTDEALADLADAVELIKSELGRSIAFALRARIYQKQGKLDDAINDYTQAIQLAPDFAYHHGNRGEIYLEKQQYEKAITDYSEAIRLDAKNPYFHRDRARAYRALGRNDPAALDETIAETLSSSTTPPPEAPPSDTNVTKTVSAGDLTDKAISLPQPPYPPIARATHASGTVIVQVEVDEKGRVVSAHAVSGHPLLQAPCIQAARQARFEPKKLSGQAVKMTGTIRYSFQ
jgi:TonB family protein